MPLLILSGKNAVFLQASDGRSAMSLAPEAVLDVLCSMEDDHDLCGPSRGLPFHEPKSGIVGQQLVQEEPMALNFAAQADYSPRPARVS